MFTVFISRLFKLLIISLIFIFSFFLFSFIFFYPTFFFNLIYILILISWCIMILEEYFIISYYFYPILLIIMVFFLYNLISFSFILLGNYLYMLLSFSFILITIYIYFPFFVISFFIFFILFIGLSIFCASPLILLESLSDIYIYYDIILNFNFLHYFGLYYNWLLNFYNNLLNIDFSIYFTFLYHLLHGNFLYLDITMDFNNLLYINNKIVYDHVFLASLPERVVGYIEGTTSPPLPAGVPPISPISPISSVSPVSSLSPERLQLVLYNPATADRNRILYEAIERVRSMPNPITLNEFLLESALNDPLSVEPFGNRESYIYRNNHALEHLATIRALVTNNAEVLDSISSFEYDGVALMPSNTINGSISLSFFRTMHDFLNNGFSRYFMGYIEKLTTVSLYELSYLSHINHYSDLYSLNLYSFFSDLIQLNSIIDRNMSIIGDIGSYFLRLPGGFYVYINPGQSHMYDINIPLNQELNIPVIDLDFLGEEVSSNKLMNAIFDLE